MIKVCEFGQIVDSRPMKRCAAAEAGPNWLEHWTIRPDLRMAVHTYFRRGYSRKRGLLNRGVAITAIDSDAAHVMLVTEWYRLSLGHPDLRDVCRPADRNRNPRYCGQQENESENSDSRQRIGAALKDPCHHFLEFKFERLEIKR